MPNAEKRADTPGAFNCYHAKSSTPQPLILLLLRGLCVVLASNIHRETRFINERKRKLSSLIGSTPNDADVTDSLTTHKAEEVRRRCLEALKTDLQDIPDERLAKFKDGLLLIALKHEVGRQRNKT
jgi:hypothetical protein